MADPEGAEDHLRRTVRSRTPRGPLVSEVRTCTGCRNSLPLERFGKDKSRKCGLSYRCTDCERQRDRQRSAAKEKRPPRERACTGCGVIGALEGMRSDAKYCPGCKSVRQCWGCGLWKARDAFQLIRAGGSRSPNARRHDYCTECVALLSASPAMVLCTWCSTAFEHSRPHEGFCSEHCRAEVGRFAESRRSRNSIGYSGSSKDARWAREVRLRGDTSPVGEPADMYTYRASPPTESAAAALGDEHRRKKKSSAEVRAPEGQEATERPSAIARGSEGTEHQKIKPLVLAGM